MWFLVAALFVASVAYNAYASRKAASKAGKPGPLEPPRVPSGTPIRVFFGTVKLEPIIVAFKVDKIDKYTKASGFLGTQEQFLGWTHTVSYIGLLGWGHVSTYRDLLFDETKLLSDETVNPRVATLTVDGVGGYYTYTSQSRGNLGPGHQELYLPNVFGGKPPQGQGELASGRNDWVGTAHKGGDFFFMPGLFGASATFAYPQSALDVQVNAYAGATEPFSFAAQPTYPRFALMALDWVNLGLADSLHKIEVIVTNAAETSDGYDAQPTNVLLKILTDVEWGLGIPEALIDADATFFNVGTALGAANGAEDFGISCVFAEQKPAEDYIGEILKTIDAALYRRPDNGKLAIQLIRGGYTVSALTALDETNVSECEWSRRDIADTTNQVTVTFTDRDWMFESNSVTVTDHANVAATGGIRAVTLDFPFVSNEARAIKIAARELKERTIPLGTGTLVVDRETWDAVPGDLFRLSWARYGLVNVPIRVLSVNPGTLEDGKLEIEVSQDAYGFPDVPYVVTEDAPSTPTTVTPLPDVPVVTERTAQDATTGTLTLLVLDEGARVTSVEFSTQSGNGAASGYVADGSVPYTATVAVDPTYPSYIYWRVLYDDDDSVSHTLSGTATFSAINTSVPPGDAQYITAVASATLTAERVATDTATVAWDFATAGQAKASVVAGSIGATELASSGVTAATYGDATHVPQIAVDVDGRITSASNVAITGGGASTLDDLTDVIITSPSNGEVLKYNGTDWVNGTASGAAALDDLTDVVVPSPSDGDVLTYDSNSGDWVNAARAGGGGIVPAWVVDSSFTAPATPNAANDEWGSSDYPTETTLDTGGTRFTGATAWAWVNQGGAAITVGNGRAALVLAAGTNTVDNVRQVVQSIPSGNWKYRVPFTYWFNGTGTNLGGLMLRESATGKLTIFGPRAGSGAAPDLRVTAFTNSTTFSTYIVTVSFFQAMQGWLEIEYDGSNYIYRFSNIVDGEWFEQITSRAKTTDFTTAADQIGLAVNTNSSTTRVVLIAQPFRRVA